MNIYIVVEGAVGEKKVYTEWIPLVNSSLSCAPTLNDVTTNNFYIAIGGGYPNIFEVIEDGIEDVATIYKNGHRLFDRLVVVIDSEEDTLADKKKEITDLVDPIILSKNISLDYKVIVQHFCLETWALGNKRINSNNINIPELIDYKHIFDVAISDPELLPPLSAKELNRAQFALKYLTLLLNNKHRNHSYSKNNPSALLDKKYFEEVKKRYQEAPLKSARARLAQIESDLQTAEADRARYQQAAAPGSKGGAGGTDMANPMLASLLLANKNEEIRSLQQARSDLVERLGPTYTYETSLMWPVYVPDRQAFPNPELTWGIGLLLGIFLGSSAALARNVARRPACS